LLLISTRSPVWNRWWAPDAEYPAGELLTVDLHRLLRAGGRHLLESTNLSVEEVADRAGFGTATSMRQHLRAAIGVSPTVYRRTFNSDPPRP
jgi:AraC-like DNA-binding protein